MTVLAPWVKRALIDAGRMDEQGLTRRARIRRCRCGLPCMAGLDAPVAALSTWCDLTELSALGEAMALVDGRPTYELWGAATERPELERRDRWRIAAHPAGAPGTHPVLARHDCAQPVPAAWAAPAAPETTIDDQEVWF